MSCLSLSLSLPVLNKEKSELIINQRLLVISLYQDFFFFFFQINFVIVDKLIEDTTQGRRKTTKLGPIKLSYIFFFFFFAQKNRNFIGNSNQPPPKLNCLQFKLQISHTTPHLISYQTQFPLLKTQNWWPHFSNHPFSLYIEVILSIKFQIYA